MDIGLIVQRFYDYSLYMRGYTKNTIRGYRSAIAYYCRFAEIKNVGDIREETLRQFFVYGRVQRHWSARTFTCFHKSLSVFLNWCVHNHYLEKNLVSEIEVPRIEKRLPVKLTKQDALKLIEIVYNYPYDYKFLRYRNHAIFSTFIFAGLRKSELLNLRLADVDIANLTIFVNQGKGNKDRIIPMSYTLAHSLKRYMEERKRLNKTCPEFFASLNRNTGFTDIGLKRLVIKIREASKLTFTVHKLRHTFATLMLEGGCDIFSLSRMMGHSDIKTTTIYLSASAEHLRSQVVKHPLNDLVRYG